MIRTKLNRARDIRYRRSVHNHYRRELDEFPWSDPSSADGSRLGLLRELGRQAAIGSPLQRQRFTEAGFDPSSMTSIDDLAQLAPITKATMREAGTDANDSSQMGADPLWWGTSGTSGEPFRFCMDHDYGIRAEALRGFLYHRFGHRRGAVIEGMGGAGVPSGRDLSIPGYARHLVVYGDPLDTQLDAITAIGPTAIYGNRSVLLQLVDGFEARGETPTIELVVSSSEALWPGDRIRLAGAFGARVHDVYGVAEATAVCFEESPSGGYRVAEPRVIMEIVDATGHGVGPGEVGDVLVTNLDNKATPFIRYFTGDRARMALDTSPSGHAGMRVASIEGRDVDRVHDHAGRPVSFWTLGTSAFWAQPPIVGSIARWQIVERGAADFVIRIEPTADGLTREAEAAIRAFVSEKLGPVQMTIETDGVEVEANGKFRGVKSLM